MIVYVATRTHRGMLDVARESYALTLWSSLQLSELEERDAQRERYARYDLAGMIAMAHHEPKALADAMTAFVDDITASRVTDDELRAKAERLQKMLRDHERMVPIPTPGA